MWPSIFRLWRARRGRRAAVAAVAPLVEQSRYRLRQIPEFVWFDPYMVGFLVALITFVAKREVRLLDSQALGLVQLEAWAAITGVKSDLIGEEVLQLSLNGHRDFDEGCRNAVAFGRVLYGASDHGSLDNLGDTAPYGGIAGGPAVDTVAAQNVTALWSDYFDAHAIDSAHRPA